MRESSLITRLLLRVEQEGRAAGAVRVTSVCLRIGECAGVEPVRLMETFQTLARGTIAQGAALRIERISLESRCESCGGRFRVVRFHFECPFCGSRRTRVVAGEEFVLESVTVVTECDPSLTWTH
jgi:hydrogenase nickel incorporation protein HypA/HybF